MTRAGVTQQSSLKERHGLFGSESRAMNLFFLTIIVQSWWTVIDCTFKFNKLSHKVGLLSSYL